MTLAAAGCRLLMDRDTEGIRNYFSLLREQWGSQLSLIVDFCDIRRRHGGGNIIEVGVETVSPGRAFGRRVLAGDLDQVVGLKTCEAGFVQP